MATSNILQFAPTDTGTNLLSDAAYLAASDRTNGNQPGVASAKLNNKALRQSSAVAAGVAQFIATRQATNITDALTPSQIETALASATTGRLLRTLVYYRIAGVQNVIIDGAAPTTSGAGTYVPGTAAAFAIMEVQGAGSGGAGATGAGAGNVSMGAPGCSGSYGMGRFSVATIGASQTVTVGIKSAGSSGAVGGTSSVGALITAPGGTAAATLSNQSPPSYNGNGSSAGTPTGANLVSILGRAPFVSVGLSATQGYGAAGGTSQFGQGAAGPGINTNGVAAVNPGSGGSGCVVNQAGGTAVGGDGADGIVVIREYA